MNVLPGATAGTRESGSPTVDKTNLEPRQTPRHLRAGRIGLALVILIAATPGINRYFFNPHLSADTFVLVQDLNNALSLALQGQWWGWGGHFPLLQQLPALLINWEVPDVSTEVQALALLNLFLFGLLLAWSWAVLRLISRRVAVILMVVLVAGPMPWYAHSSFGEMAAALVTLGLVISCLSPRAAVSVAFFMFLATISKDVALPFLVLLAGAATIAGQMGAGRSWITRRRAVSLALGAIAGLVVVIAFNMARFGSPLDPTNMDPLLHVPSWSIRQSFFLAIWASPNGGIVPFWPAQAVFLGLCAWGATAAVRDAPTQSRTKTVAPAMLAAAALIGLTAGFSDWVAPLGWVTWGPRLMMPWLPAIDLLLAFAYAPQIEALLVRWGRRRLAAPALLACLAAASLPQYVILARPSLWDPLWRPDATCPRVPYVQQGVSYYYRCTIHQLWDKPSVLGDAYNPAADLTAFVFGCACCASVVILGRRSLSPLET